MAEQLDESLLSPDETAQGAPRIRLGEMGYPGIALVYKQIYQERDRDLRMPRLIKTIDLMKHDSTIAAALQFYKMMLGRVKWKIQPPTNADDKQLERAKFIESCMGDMSHSWFSFIINTLSMIDYGFSIHEKNYKIRRKDQSKYDDGLIGWDSFPSRAQSTVFGWNFSDNGRKLLGFQQIIPAGTAHGQSIPSQPINIPREKFMLFRTSPQDDNPEGNAALKAAYTAWKFKTELQKQELVGASRDLGGLLKLKIPAAYMDPNADAAKVAVYSDFKTGARNVSNGEQSAIILPSDHNMETKEALFDAELLTSQGAKAYDTNEIIARYNSDILITLFADLLQLGNGETGSFALAGTKVDVIQYALEYRLKEIQDVLNFDLIPQTFRMNKWDDTDYPTFEFEGLSSPDLETISKFCQRVAAVGAIDCDLELLNYTRSLLGLQPKDSIENVPDKTSKSGAGMASGLPSGTGDAIAADANSSINMDNAA